MISASSEYSDYNDYNVYNNYNDYRESDPFALSISDPACALLSKIFRPNATAMIRTELRKIAHFAKRRVSKLYCPESRKLDNRPT